MPQMIVEYSDNIQNLDIQKLLSGLNQSLFETGLVNHPDDIKSRARANSDYLIGFGDNPQAYIHVRLAILTGRSSDQKNLMADQLSAFLNTFETYQAEGLEIQLCVEIAEMPKEHYRKVKISK